MNGKANPLQRALAPGFTLIELLVVVVIIAILVTLAIPKFNQLRKQARNAVTATNLNEIQKALQAFSADNNGLYPFRVRWFTDQTYANGKNGQPFDPYTTEPDYHSEASSGSVRWFSLGLFGGVQVVNPDLTDNRYNTVSEQSAGINTNKFIQPAGWDVPFYQHFNQYSDPLVALGYLDGYPTNPFLRRPMGNIMWSYGNLNWDGSGPNQIDKSLPAPEVTPTPGDFCYTFFYRVDPANPTQIMQPRGVTESKKSYTAKTPQLTMPGVYYVDLIDSYQLWAYGDMKMNGANYVVYRNNGALMTRGLDEAAKDWDNSGIKDMFEAGLVNYYKVAGSGGSQEQTSGGNQLEF